MNKQLFDNLPENLQTLISKGDYETAFNEASSITDKQAVVELYLEDAFSDVWSQLKESKDIISKICIELETLDNSFIDFIKIYKDRNRSVPNRKGFVALNNLYSDEIIDDHDLDDTSKERDTSSFSIIFNPNLYNKNDIEFLVKSYYWLSQKNNLKRMNLYALAEANVDENVQEVAKKLLQSNQEPGNELRNVIMYVIDAQKALNESSIMNNENVRDSKEVENILHASSSRYHNNDNNGSDKVADALSTISKLNDNEKLELFKKLGITQ